MVSLLAVYGCESINSVSISTMNPLILSETPQASVQVGYYSRENSGFYYMVMFKMPHTRNGTLDFSPESL